MWGRELIAIRMAAGAEGRFSPLPPQKMGNSLFQGQLVSLERQGGPTAGDNGRQSQHIHLLAEFYNGKTSRKKKAGRKRAGGVGRGHIELDGAAPCLHEWTSLH